MTKTQEAVAAYLRKAGNEVLREQIAVARIPSPDWRARERAAYLVKALEAEGLSPSLDKMGNVVAVRKGTKTGKGSKTTLIIAAHIDSVFYDVEKPEITKKGKILYGPGISDNAAGVANLILLARAMKRFKAKTRGDVILVGSSGEEGEGRLRGMRHFFKANKFKNAAFVAVDGSSPGRLTTTALASWSPRITVKGSGGHSFGNFGRPNPLHMLARFTSKVTTLKSDKETSTVYNATIVRGGTAVNVIPAEATMTLNIRSCDVERLAALKKQTLEFLREARREELEWATEEGELTVRYTALERPGGRTSHESALVKAATKAFEAERLKPVNNTASTDANMPMSLGIPAICISAGGKGANLHSMEEWTDTTGRTKELAALARIVFAIAG